MDIRETIEFTNAVNKLAKLYPNLMHIAATEAVNFSKERFVQQNWVGERTIPWKKRKEKKNAKRKGRAILVDTGRLKRDVQKIYVGSTSVIIGTTRLTPYAKAHNEGFRGRVVVKEHKRHRYVKVKERYVDKKGKNRTRTSKQMVVSEKGSAAKPIIVGTHYRRMNIPQRQFLGASPVLDTRIERVITTQFIKALKSI